MTAAAAIATDLIADEAQLEKHRPTLYWYEITIPVCSYHYVAAKATLYSFASWQNRHFGGVFRP